MGDRLPLVVGVDGSAQSILALKWAKKLAKTLNAPILAVSVWNVEVTNGPYIAPTGRADAQAVLTQALSDAYGDEMPEGLVTECDLGSAARVLVKKSAAAQMLILGSRGHGGFAGMLLGSVSSSVAAHAKCPVLVVHGEMDPEA